ncbi:SDR family oxidoreductase [Schauerella aestuarii]|uniref:SDR family oxidoreductase n=1 Tax=Schauerella aestuarii TaxID=2511204 RepID=UPI001369B2F7|nr:SDR family oxidoreductase [Achromobacter aestuarii]MYZ45255.1 NAD(P)-dependent oxidoreductase [Achromobacter aestuarii]
MSSVFIVGAAGNIGRRLVERLANRGHEPRALHRKPEQADTLKDLGATPVAGDLTALDAPALAQLMAGSKAVVFTAGAGGAGMDVTNAIDGRGLETTVDAAQLAGIKRFLLVSAFPDAGRGKTPSEGFENYMAVKKRADVYLVDTDLDWVIVRPGTLSDEPGTGHVRADVAIPYGNVPRDDVAAFLAEVIDQPTVNRIIIELTEGETPIANAVDRLQRG